MLDKINEKLEKEINKILEKENLSFEEIKFLDSVKTTLEMKKVQEEQKEENKKRNKEWMESMVKTISQI